MAKNTMTEVVEQAKKLPKMSSNPFVGRLRYSARRFSWAIRFDSTARTFDDGSKWEPVQEVVS